MWVSKHASIVLLPAYAMPVDEKSNINTEESFVQHIAPPPFSALTLTIEEYAGRLQCGTCLDTHRLHHKLYNCWTYASLRHAASTTEGVLTTSIMPC